MPKCYCSVLAVFLTTGGLDSSREETPTLHNSDSSSTKTGANIPLMCRLQRKHWVVKENCMFFSFFNFAQIFEIDQHTMYIFKEKI